MKAPGKGEAHFLTPHRPIHCFLRILLSVSTDLPVVLFVGGDAV